MSKKTEQLKDIRNKSEADIKKLIQDNREILRAERFKDKFTRKAGVVRNAKKTIARASTELTARGNTK